MRYQFSTIILLSLTDLVFSQACKCADEWEILNQTISGRLIQAVPPGALCYPSRPEYDPVACQALISNWTLSSWHAENPVSIDGNVYTNNSCNPIYPNGTSVTGDPNAGNKGCSQGFYPSYVVNVTEASDVQQGLAFAKRFNLRTTIKNTGHNGGGRNTAYSSLSFWTHNLKSFGYHNAFQLCSSNGSVNETLMAVTVGGGTQDFEMLAKLSKFNSTTVTGTNPFVGVVGWATGGGHGFMTGAYGNGVDNIIQATIVTPSGELLIANECENSDIFWAIRGGGGGTFGVIMNITLKAYEMPSVAFITLNVTANTNTTSKDWWNFIAKYHSLLPDIEDQDLHGYYTIKGPNMNLLGSVMLFNTDNATAMGKVKPLKQFLDANNAIISYMPLTPVVLPTYFDLVAALPNEEHTGITSGITASRLLTREAVTKNQTLLAETFELIGPSVENPSTGNPSVYISGTMTLSKTAVDNALNPAWRNSVVHVITSQTFDDSITPPKVIAMVNDMTCNKLNALRELDPTSGAYLNEANVFEPGRQWSFWGPNYSRLRAIKQKYDPDGILWCPHCPGSEDWVQSRDGALCPSWQPFVTE